MTKDKIKCDCPSCLAFGKHCPHKVNGDPYYYNCTMTVEALEKENYELLGLIQAKDKLIEKMKRCKNCEFSIPICDTHCQDCDEHYSNWRLAE